MNELITDAIDRIRTVYADLESLGEERNCIGRTTCCRFRLTGKTPMLTAGEALVAASGFRASGRKKIADSENDPDGSCPFLGVSGKCTIYESRPFGCRTHFCAAAGGQISRSIVQPQIRRLEEVAEVLGDTDVRPIAAAVADALGKLPKRRRDKRR